MSCNNCGEEYGIRLYYCEKSDCDICENCIFGYKSHCNNIDDEGTKCEYINTCKIYNMKEE